MSDGMNPSPEEWRPYHEPEQQMTYVDANTGEFLQFAGDGWPTTDEEAELLLPRPPNYSKAALNIYYSYRQEGQTIREAVISVMKVIGTILGKGD